MLKFFRNIRQRLLLEVKIGKYLTYALGEIVLVMIGILLALQINNWNENRKDRLFEKKILSQIITSLEQDLGRTTYLLEGRAKKKKNAITNIMAKLNEPEIIADSLYKDFFMSSMTLSFSFDKGPYESLKSIGLDKISNDSLRNTLVRFYEVSLPLTDVFLVHEKELQAERREALRDELINYVYENNDGVWKIKPQIDFTTLANDQNIKKLLYMENKIAVNYNIRLENITDEFREMIKYIGQELKKL